MNCFCRLPSSHCICIGTTPLQTELRFKVLLHPNEWHKATNTARIAAGTLSSVKLTPWQRTINLPAVTQSKPCLLFPADRNPPPQQLLAPSELKTDALVILLDGSWKQCRKMLRQSTWLQQLPRLSLLPRGPSRYPLRRGAAEGQLCTAEAIVELLHQCGETEPAAQLELQLLRFYHHYLSFKSGHLPRATR